MKKSLGKKRRSYKDIFFLAFLKTLFVVALSVYLTGFKKPILDSKAIEVHFLNVFSDSIEQGKI